MLSCKKVSLGHIIFKTYCQVESFALQPECLSIFTSQHTSTKSEAKLIILTPRGERFVATMAARGEVFLHDIVPQGVSVNQQFFANVPEAPSSTIRYALDSPASLKPLASLQKAEQNSL